jgi:hemerythrin-like domain-containing protein
MLMDHDQGRDYVRAMEEAAKAALAGTPGQQAAIALNAVSYLELLREHIAKEDDILYPLAERLIPEEMRDGIIAGYAAAERRTPADFAAKYEMAVERYEAEALVCAA